MDQIGAASGPDRDSRPSNRGSSLRRSRLPATRASVSASTSVSAVAVTSTFIGRRRRSAWAPRNESASLVSIIAPVRVRVLRSAAGGGFPQRNCRCPTCEAARAGDGARPRTQSSLALRGAEGPWFLANASPDLRQQLEALGAEGHGGGRGERG